MPVTLYSRNHCVQCNATKRYLEEHGVEYREVNLSDEPEALEYVKSLGYLQAPVVVTKDLTWAGFRPDYLDAFTAGLKAA